MIKRSRRARLPAPDSAWPVGPHHERVLLEISDGALAWATRVSLQEQGYDVAICSGPSADAGQRCPLEAGGTCGLLDDADAVVFAAQGVPLDARKRLLNTICSTRPDAVVFADLTGVGGAGGSPENLVPMRLSHPRLLDGLRRALDEPQR